MAYKIGLKLWSVNTDFYLSEAKKLYDNGIYDYIELYVVPGSLDTLSEWQKLNIPFIMHNAHFAHGFNLAKAENKDRNREIYEETKRFADELNAQYIIFHGGMDGNIEETAKQLVNFNEPRALIENKPYIAPKGEKRHCRGYSIEEISQVMSQTGCGFCLDIGHAVCAANSINKEPYAYLAEFEKLLPTMYHISGNYIDSTIDRHLHLYEGNFDINKIFKIINTERYISIETNKESKENLDDFVNDAKFYKEKLNNE